MMLRKPLLKILQQLREDIVDFEHVHPATAECIAEWIEEDRQHTAAAVKESSR